MPNPQRLAGSPSLWSGDPRVRFFALGSDSLASSRLRAWELSRALTAAGMYCDCVVGPSIRGAAKALSPAKIDVTVIQKWTPPQPVLSTLRARSSVLIFDVDDAIYLDTGRGGASAERDRSRLAAALPHFDAFTVSTETIADDLRERCPGRPVLVYPGPIALPAAFSGNARRGAMWLGSPATERYLGAWRSQLLELDRRIGFAAMGAGPDFADLNAEAWSLTSQEEMLNSVSIGLFVQDTGEWELRKSGYKLLEYIAHGVVPVAERTRASEEILGADYPFLFESDLLSAASGAADLSADDRAQTLQTLLRRASQFSFDSVAREWVRFVSAVGLS